jgi:hypothetical protein
VAERARSIPAARLSRSVEGGITKTIGGLVGAISSGRALRRLSAQ